MPRRDIQPSAVPPKKWKPFTRQFAHLNEFLSAPKAQQDKWLRNLDQKRANKHSADWGWWRREDQAEPEGDWRVWLVMAGRGFGKTRMGAEWVRKNAEANPRLRIALVGATLAEARAVMVEGQSGLLAIAPEATRPVFEASLRRLIWPNGAIAMLYSAAEPESLRGPEHHIAWCDEIAKWDKGEAAWDNLSLTMRLSATPKILATTTPRSVALVRRLAKEAGVAISRGPTRANALHLPQSWLDGMDEIYGETQLGRQELGGELLTNIEGALWSRDLIEQCRLASGEEAHGLSRVVIGVDPPASATGDACGIISVGLRSDGQGIVLGDHSVARQSPEGWARAVASAAARWGADRVVAEANNGGAMIESILRAADVSMPVRLVHASRGKVARAEPVAALYERDKISHAGIFPALEDELCGLVHGGYCGPGRSPDRADALVWAITELMLGKVKMEPRIRVF